MCNEQEQNQAIKNFFKAAEELKRLGIVRSSSYVGNIAEFVCANLFNIELSESQREKGLDGTDPNGRKVEIKYHNAEKGTNIVMSKYKQNKNFDDLIVIIGPNSSLKPKNCKDNHYRVYKIKDYQYKKHGNIAKKKLQNAKLEYELDDNLKQV